MNLNIDKNILITYVIAWSTIWDKGLLLFATVSWTGTTSGDMFSFLAHWTLFYAVSEDWKIVQNLIIFHHFIRVTSFYFGWIEAMFITSRLKLDNATRIEILIHSRMNCNNSTFRRHKKTSKHIQVVWQGKRNHCINQSQVCRINKCIRCSILSDKMNLVPSFL